MMKIKILDLENNWLEFDLSEVGRVFKDDDIIYFNGIPCILSSARPFIHRGKRPKGVTHELISVKDKMPPHGQSVLATYVNGYGKRRHIIACHLGGWREENRYGDNDDIYGEVDYWMPIPPVPGDGS